MKKLLLVGAIIAAIGTTSAFAGITSGCDPSGSFCISPGGPDGDDTAMFNNGANKDVDSFYGSTTGNGSHSTNSVLITTGPLVGGVGPLVTTGNGFANIKAEDSSLTSITWTPQTGFTFDGFWTRAQMEFTPTCTGSGCTSPPATSNVFLQVNGGPIFQFAETLPEKNDFAYIGFDEPQTCDANGKNCVDNEAKAALIASVTMWVTDPGVSFFENKQTLWSSCAVGGGCSSVVINPTIPAPEPASLPLLVMGLAGLGMVVRTRRARAPAPP